MRFAPDVLSVFLCSVCDEPARTRGLCAAHYQRLQRGRPLEEPFLRTVEERFWAKVDCFSVDECWFWVGGLTKDGYGQFTVDGKNGCAHRWAYEHLIGPIPEGLELDHLCRVVNCVNPAHLEAVTPKENQRRSLSPWGINARKTLCKRGHEFAPEVRPWNGQRFCPTCLREHAREFYRKKVAEKQGGAK